MYSALVFILIFSFSMQRSFYRTIICLISISSFISLYAEDSIPENTGGTDTGATIVPVISTGATTRSVVEISIPPSINTGTTDSGVTIQTQSVQALLAQPTTIMSASPTIHSIPGYGNWNDPASWSENRIPTEADIVEINGTMNLNVSPTIAGLSITT